MRRPGVLLVFILVAQFAAAQSLSVAYLEGEAEVRSGSGWTELSTGDALTLDSSIRLGDGCLVQVKGVGVDFTLTRPGIYSVRTVAVASRSLATPAVSSAVTSSLRYLAFGSTKNQSTAMGARGANESKSDEEGWTESSAQVFLDAGKEYIKAGKYDKAIEQLKEALYSATDEETPEIHYYLGYASSLNGDVKEAWRQTAGLQPRAEAEWYGDFVLLKAKLLEDSSAYSEAVALLTHEGNALTQDAQRAALYYFLLGLGFSGAGDGDQAKKALSKVVSISGESDLGRAAGELLRGL